LAKFFQLTTDEEQFHSIPYQRIQEGRPMESSYLLAGLLLFKIH